MQGKERFSRTLPARQQTYIVAGLAIAAVSACFLFFFVGTGSGLSQTPQKSDRGKLATFIPTAEQLASLRLQVVQLRQFRTEIVTDGYIAPNGGFTAPGASSDSRIAHGLPFLTGQSSDVLQAESDLATATAQFRVAQAAEKRQHELYDTDGAALKDWQQSQVDLATAAASLASARNRLRLLGKADEEVAAARTGPISREPSNAVFSVGDGVTVWMIANVREADASLVHLGDQVDVHVPALAKETFQAVITYVASMIDPVTHRLVVGAQIHNADGKLKPNMLATFVILAGQATRAPAIPQNAVIYEGDTARVWVLSRNGDLALHAITIGRTNGDYAEVTSGLSGGERIVTGGALFIDQAALGS